MKGLFMYSMLLAATLTLGFSCEEPEIEDPNDIITLQDTTYYINTQEDFNRLNGLFFPAGSTIAFAAGETFTGRFLVRGDGVPDQPNLVTAYDPESGNLLMEWTDNKPVINGKGIVKAPVYLENSNYWKINNIEVTNTDGTYEDQGEIFGIYVVAKDFGIMKGITVSNCYVHHVNGRVGGKETGGIRIDVLGDDKVTKFNDVLIENNIVSRVGGVGIANQSSYGNIRSDNFHPWTGYVVRGNKVEYTGRNGIIVRYSTDPLVEYNVAAFNSLFDVGHSIFNFNTVNCIVQYNEAYGNTSDDLEEIDRGGFDCDFNSRNTIYQYNYSHNNHWFIAVQRRDINHGVIIRYNISENEKLGAYMYGFPEYDGLTNVQIYNNTHYFGKGTGNRIFIRAKKDRIPTQTEFTNNIFYFEDEAEWGFTPDNTCTLDNNLFYNVSPKGTNAITSDPLLMSPGTGGFKIDMTDPDRLAGYRLKPGSPALKTGKIIPGNGGKNFAGETLDEDAVNIGAF
jgi:hypothetical protein